MNSFFRIIAFVLLLAFFSIGKINAQTFNGYNPSFQQDSLVVLDINKEVNSAVFNYKKCNFDLSEFTYLAVDIQNNSNERLIADVQYFGSQKNHINQGRFFIEAKETETTKLILYRPKLTKTSPWYDYFSEVRGLPGGFVTHWNAFNLKEVKKIIVTISSPNNTNIDGQVSIKKPYGYKSFEFPSINYEAQKMPIIDEMGQYIAANWEGKLNGTKQLESLGAADIKKYANAEMDSQFSKYGGWKNGPKVKATGYFYTTKHKGKWYFADPEGYLFWSQGVTGVNSNSSTSPKNREELFSGFELDKSTPEWMNLKGSISKNRINYYELNLKRKYGFNWQQSFDKVSIGRMKSWGLNTHGAWSKPPLVREHPFTLIIHPKKQGIGKLNKMVDPFSTEFKSNLMSNLQALKKHRNNPWLLGVFVNNELHFNSNMSIPLQVLTLENSVPARKAFENFLKEKYKSIEELNTTWNCNFKSFKTVNGDNRNNFTKSFREDMIAYFKFFAETYFKTISEEFKKVLPNHLYFGSRFHGQVKYNKEIHEVASKYCDVISFNIYEYSVKDFKVHTEIDKPAIIGEFHFGTGSHGVWGVGLRSATNVENQAQLYKQYMYDVIKHPNFIGAHWFQWVDQLATGRGNDGENFRIGLVNITDQPYTTMVKAIKETSTNLYNLRQE